MDFRTHYQRELSGLLETGKAFAKIHDQAKHLAQRSGDPDVERLLEGFAYLSAKIHARMDSAEPQIIHHLCELVAPQHLNPVPSCTMVEYSSNPKLGRCALLIDAADALVSRPIQGVPLRFRSTQALRILPMAAVDTRLSCTPQDRCRVELRIHSAVHALTLLREQGTLDLYVHGTCAKASDLTVALMDHCTHITVGITPQGQAPQAIAEINSPKIEALGFAGPPLLAWPNPAARGDRLLAEYLTLPQKFRQLRLHGLCDLPPNLQCETLWIHFELDLPPSRLAPVDPQALRLHCTPAINLFSCDAEPLRQHGLDDPQRIRAAGLGLQAFEVYDILDLTRLVHGEEQRRKIPCFFKTPTPQQGPSYLIERRRSSLDGHTDAYLRLVHPTPQTITQRDLLSMELLCTHRGLCHELRCGDIGESERALAPHIQVTNLTVPTRPCPASLQDELQWRLFGAACRSQRVQPQVEDLRALFELYDSQSRMHTVQAATNAKLRDALRDLSHEARSCLVQGVCVRGRQSRLELDERDLSWGQQRLLGQLIDELLADWVGLNAVHATQLRLHPSKRTRDYPPRSGTQILT